MLASASIGRFPILADLTVPTLADLTVPTLAAFVPKDWSIEICDEHGDDVNFDTPAEVIAITAKVSQRARTNVLATEFRRRGKLVLVSGPHVSL